MKISLKRVIGINLILAPFAILFIVLAVEISLEMAGLIFSIAFGTAVIMIFGVYLAVSEDE